MGRGGDLRQVAQELHIRRRVAEMIVADQAAKGLAAELPEPSQYAVPLAFRVRWRITINLRAAYHLAELRSAPQGHPAYRRIAQAIYAQIRAAHPTLAEAMRFVDTSDYALERLDAERRLDARLGQR